MENLLEYVRKELADLDAKAKNGVKLTGNEIEYLDKMTHSMKSILSIKMLEENARPTTVACNDTPSRSQGRNRPRHDRESARRRAKRNRMEDAIDRLEEIMDNAPAELREDISDLIEDLEDM